MDRPGDSGTGCLGGVFTLLLLPIQASLRGGIRANPDELDSDGKHSKSQVGGRGPQGFRRMARRHDPAAVGDHRHEQCGRDPVAWKKGYGHAKVAPAFLPLTSLSLTHKRHGNSKPYGDEPVKAQECLPEGPDRVLFYFLQLPRWCRSGFGSGALGRVSWGVGYWVWKRSWMRLSGEVLGISARSSSSDQPRWPPAVVQCRPVRRLR